jgi:hypothetical protein
MTLQSKELPKPTWAALEEKMGSTRATTMAQKFGFMDPDLKTPEHDAICCWFEEHAGDLLAPWLPGDLWEPDEIVNRLGKEDPEPSMPPKPECEIIVKWESCIKNKKGYEIGFMDLEIIVRRPSVIKNRNTKWVKADYASGVADPRDAYNEYEGCHGHYEWLNPHTIAEVMWRKPDLYFFVEAKSRIDSLGELFRQLSLYRDNLGDSKIIVCCPDDAHAKRIEGQGYGFVKAAP